MGALLEFQADDGAQVVVEAEWHASGAKLVRRGDNSVSEAARTCDSALEGIGAAAESALHRAAARLCVTGRRHGPAAPQETSALVVGRMPGAAAAAARLGVPYVGIADGAGSAADLRAAGATPVTTSLGAITDALQND